MRKKVILFLFTLVVAALGAFTLTACGGGGSQGGDGETPEIVYDKTPVAHTPQGGAAAAHVWDAQNKCTVCKYELNVTQGLIYTETEGGLSVALGTTDGENFVCAEGLTEAEEIVIPAYHEGKPVVHIGDYNENAFWNGTFKTLVIPNTVKTAGDYALYYCNNLEVAYVGCDVFDGLFYEIDSLKSVYLAPDVKSIGIKAFYSCGGLNEITLPDGVTTIGEKAFIYCSSLESIVIPDSVTEIGESAYNGCSSVETLTIGAGVTTINKTAFTDLKHIVTLEIPAKVNYIGKNAFLNCYRLVEIHNLSSVEIVLNDESENNCRAGDYALNVYTAESGAAGEFFNENNFEFYTINGQTSMIGYTGNAQNLILPASVKGGDYKIHAHALAHASFVNLEIGDGVTEIGYSAFSGCLSLRSVKIGGAVTEITNYAFSGCSSLNSVELGAKIQKVGIGAFSQCGSLLEIGNFSETLEVTGKIGGMPNMPLNIYTSPEDKGSFSTVGEYEYYNFKGRDLLCKYNGTATELTLPADYKGGNYEIAPAAFRESSLTSVNIGNGITQIGEEAFYLCSKLSSVTLGNSLTVIGISAFHFCRALESVTIPASVTKIRSNAFFSTKLTSATFEIATGWKNGNGKAVDFSDAAAAANTLSTSRNGNWSRA